MNSKLIKASLAGVAAIAVTAGGTTFAAWSDFDDINGNAVGAGLLRLTLSPNAANPGADSTFDNIMLAPGQYYERQVYIATNDAASTPNARLFFDISSITGSENGCDSNSETATDDCERTDPDDPGSPFLDPTGDLIDQATLTVASYEPTASGTCNTSKQVLPTRTWNLSALAAGTFPSSHLPAAPSQLELTGEYFAPAPAPAGMHSGVVNNKDLVPGEGMCVGLTVTLPNQANNNQAQGDDLSFDMRFEVQQSTASYDAPGSGNSGVDYFVS